MIYCLSKWISSTPTCRRAGFPRAAVQRSRYRRFRALFEALAERSPARQLLHLLSPDSTLRTESDTARSLKSSHSKHARSFRRNLSISRPNVDFQSISRYMSYLRRRLWGCRANLVMLAVSSRAVFINRATFDRVGVPKGFLF